MTAVADESQAKEITDTLIKENLAACVNRISSHSTFTWKGKVERTMEQVLLIKTLDSKAKEAMACLKKIHPYDTPEILLLDTKESDADYLKWAQDLVE